jgi:hypothetical protein
MSTVLQHGFGVFGFLVLARMFLVLSEGLSWSFDDCLENRMETKEWVSPKMVDVELLLLRHVFNVSRPKNSLSM